MQRAWKKYWPGPIPVDHPFLKLVEIFPGEDKVIARFHLSPDSAGVPCKPETDMVAFADNHMGKWSISFVDIDGKEHLVKHSQSDHVEWMRKAIFLAFTLGGWPHGLPFVHTFAIHCPIVEQAETVSLSPGTQLASVTSLANVFGVTEEKVRKILDVIGCGILDCPDGKDYVHLWILEVALMKTMLGCTWQEATTNVRLSLEAYALTNPHNIRKRLLGLIRSTESPLL